jgi:quinolinate synthase
MTVVDRMPAGDLANRITESPTGYAGVDGDEEWAAEVRRLADLRGATLLAHNYQLPAIQDVADHVGDSLALSRIAAQAPEDTIVFCGVHFMAETAKILSPDKTVLIPDQRAGCSLADSITADELRAWKGRAPRRRRGLLRRHDRRGEGRDRHLLRTSSNAVEGGGVHPRGPRGAVLPGPVPRRPRARITGRKNLARGPANAASTRDQR